MISLHPQIEPKLNWAEDIGPYQFSHRITSSPYEIGKYAPHLHISAYHENVRKVHVCPCANEIIQLDIPRKYTLSDTKRFIAEHEQALFDQLKALLDGERDVTCEPLTYNSKIPFRGTDYPTRFLHEPTESNGHWNKDALCLKPGLSPEAIRNTALDLLGEMAYAALKPRVDHFAKKMKVKYSALEIDDGRRTFGSFNIMTKAVFLSRRLLMMSESIIDFLIVHELAHAEITSHNEERDAEMGKVLANYEELDSEFIESCNRLFLQGWI